jgi:drug/metabolite transporter (DMT)-like permease
VLAVVLALGCSACYGVSNFVGPRLAREHALVSVLFLSQVAALVACAVYLAGERGAVPPAEGLWLALLAGLGNGLGLIGFYKATQLGPLSIVAPIGALGTIVPVGWGFAHGDTVSAIQVAGVVLAIGGAALAARSTAEGAGSAGTLAHPDPRAAAILAAASAVAFGVFLVALPAASEYGRAWALLDARLVLVVVVAVWAGRRLAAIPFDRTSATFAVPGLLLVAGTVLYTAAVDVGQLSVVSVLASLFPVVTVGLGVALLGERLSRAQAIGVTAALSGIVLIAA